MNPEDLRNKKREELEKLLADKKAELHKTQFAIKSAEESNVLKKRFIRREIAQIQTVLNEQEINAVLEESKQTK
jgi:ribosomal protein L29